MNKSQTRENEDFQVHILDSTILLTTVSPNNEITTRKQYTKRNREPIRKYGLEREGDVISE